jgi:hypothetical protein
MKQLNANPEQNERRAELNPAPLPNSVAKRGKSN